MIGYGWHPPRGQATEEHFSQAEALLDNFFTEVLSEFRADRGRAILLGFSQGGGMTYRMGLGRPNQFAALVGVERFAARPGGACVRGCRATGSTGVCCSRAV